MEILFFWGSWDRNPWKSMGARVHESILNISIRPLGPPMPRHERVIDCTLKFMENHGVVVPKSMEIHFLGSWDRNPWKSMGPQIEQNIHIPYHGVGVALLRGRPPLPWGAIFQVRSASSIFSHSSHLLPPVGPPEKKKKEGRKGSGGKA